jgi:predicted permease
VTEQPPKARQRAAGLTRDIFANVVANIIVAALGYLAGIATGLWKGNSNLTRLCVVIAIPGLMLAGLLFASLRKQDRDDYLVIAASLAGPALLLAAIVFDVGWLFRGLLAGAGATVIITGWKFVRHG